MSDFSQPAPVRAPSFAAPEALVEAQFRFRENIALLMDNFSEEKSAAAVASLLAIGFLYGVLHALGPGHRKTVMFSLFIAKKARFHEPLLGGLLSASLHGMSATLLILAFSSLSKRLFMKRVNSAALYMEGFTYILLALLAAVLLIVELISLRGEGKESNRGLYGTIALTSLFPCPAAIIILIFSLTLDLFPLGVMTVASLSLGMGVTISAIGYLAWAGRTTLIKRFEGREKQLHRLSHILEGASYVFLILFSLWMALPFLVSLPELI